MQTILTNNWISILLVLIIMLTGCNTVDVDNKKSSSVPIYTAADNKQQLHKKIPLPKKFITQKNKELSNQFPLLPNPRINLFVYPHLSKDGHPIPGYTTVFPLYETDHYALPHEVY